MPQQKPEGLDLLAIAKCKFTLVYAGAMGGTRRPVVTRGWIETTKGYRCAFSEPRKRNMYDFAPILAGGAIVLKGHRNERPLFESHVPSEGGVTSLAISTPRMHFVDVDGDDGASLMAYLRMHCAFHTLRTSQDIKLLEPRKAAGQFERTPKNPEFTEQLLGALGDPVEVEETSAPEPTRKSLFTPAMIAKLKAACGKEPPKPIFKLFMPEGAATWLVCSMESDGDTMWAVCDLGFGCVEYGTVSLKEIEETRGPTFKLPPERDLYWKPPTMSLRELLSLDTLQKAK